MLVLILLLIGGGIYAYIANKQRIEFDNFPYEPDTPAPDPHDGKFENEHGSMTFNGDGKSVTFDFDQELSELIGIPDDIHEGTYTFLSGYLAPHGYVDVRYDTAFELEIVYELNGERNSVMIDLGLADDDGSSATSGTDTVTETRIPLMFQVENRFISYVFNKQ